MQVSGWGKSEVYKINTIGKRQEPWGQPANMLKLSEQTDPVNTSKIALKGNRIWDIRDNHLIYKPIMPDSIKSGLNIKHHHVDF